MNLSDTEVIAGKLEENGNKQVFKQEEADLILVNTCAVRQKSEEKAYGFIGRTIPLRKNNPSLKVGVCGCVAEKENKNLLRRKGVDFVFGTRTLNNVAENVSKAFRGKRFVDLSDTTDEINSDTFRVRANPHHAWITIIYGCNRFCTYCIVPYTRDREKSRPLADVLKEVKDLAKKGYKEITFLGQNVDSYGKDLLDERVDFADLLEEAAKEDNIERIWFLTSHPADFSERIIDTIASNPKIARTVHLPVQAGSDRILKKMNRRYTRSDYYSLINTIKERIPDVSLSTDVIVGFPDETDEEFQETLRLVEDLRFERLNIAMYSERSGTIASKLMKDEIPYAVKNHRLQILLKTQKNINREINEKFMGEKLTVIGERLIKDSGMMYGRSENNKIVIFPSEPDFIGKTLEIKIKRVTAGPIYGDVVK